MKGTPWRCRSDSSRDEMSQLHSNILRLLQDKKSVKISTAKLRKLKDGLKKLHEETTGCGQEISGYFAVALQNQQQETSTLTNGPVPHFLESVTQYILRNYATQEGIIRKNGNERRVMGLKDFMERSGAVIPPEEYSVHDVTCVLKRWLRCLPEPVVPRVLHDIFAKCVELDSHHHSTQALLLACLLLPTFHLNTLKHIAVFLQEIAKNDLCNKMTSENLAKVLAPSLMPRVVKGEMDPEVVKKFSKSSTTALQVLIDNAPMIGVLPPEYEALRDGKVKDFSEDDLSDCEGPSERQHTRRKLFTFLKSKGSSSHQRASVLRTPQQPSKRMASAKNVPQSCPPKMTKAALNDQMMKRSGGASGSKQQTPPSEQNETMRSFIAVGRATTYSGGLVAQGPHLGNSPQGGARKSSRSPFRSPPLQNETAATLSAAAGRPTRSASRRLKLENAEQLRAGRQETRKEDEADTVDGSALSEQISDSVATLSEGGESCVPRGKVRLSRNRASVRSLPAQSSRKSLMQRQQRQRASVRRSATVRAAMKFSCAPQTSVTTTTRQASAAVAVPPTALARRSPLTRGVVARKASLRESSTVRCSPRKPPRTTRLTDAGIKVRVQKTRVDPPLDSVATGERKEYDHFTREAQGNSAEPEQQHPETSSDLGKGKSVRTDGGAREGLRRTNSPCQPKSCSGMGNVEEVAAIIGQLSVIQTNSPIEQGRTTRRSLRLSSRGEDDNHMSNGGNAEHQYNEDDEFILRTVKDDVNVDPCCGGSESHTKADGDENSDGNRLAGGIGRQSQPTSSSSLMSAMVSAAKWRVSKRHQETKDAESGLNNSGTCVDSEDETSDSFVDGVEFMRKLTADERRGSQNDRVYQRETRASFMVGMLDTDTPVRTTTATREESDKSPNSRRESVIAIRVSRAGFVRRNVREIENTFATPIGKAVRARHQNNTPSANCSSKFHLATTPTSTTSVVERHTEASHREEPSRRPLTPGNPKKILGGRRPIETTIVTSPMDI